MPPSRHADSNATLTPLHDYPASDASIGFPDAIDPEALELLSYRHDNESEDELNPSSPDDEQCENHRSALTRNFRQTMTAGKSRRLLFIVKPVQLFFSNNTGLLLVAVSQAFFAFMNVAVKKLNGLDPPVSALQLVFVRMAITYICGIIYMLCRKIEDPWIGPKGVRLLLVFRGFSGFFGLFGIYYSLQYLSLSDATVLTFLAPLCTGIAGSLVLGEEFTWKEAIAGVCSLIGVILIARPPFLFGAPGDPETQTALLQLNGTLGTRILELSDASSPTTDIAEKGTPQQRLIAVGVALIGVLGSTGAYTSIRAIGKRAHPLHMMSSFSLQCIIVSAIAMISIQTPIVVPSRILWLLLLLQIGIFGFVAQIFLTMGLQRETAGRGTMAVYTLIVFSAILDRIFFHSTPSPSSITGTLIIVASAIWVAVTKENKTTVLKSSSNHTSTSPEQPLRPVSKLQKQEGTDIYGQQESDSVSALEEGLLEEIKQ